MKDIIINGNKENYMPYQLSHVLPKGRTVLWFERYTIDIFHSNNENGKSTNDFK